MRSTRRYQCTAVAGHWLCSKAQEIVELPVPINPFLPVLAVHGRLFSAEAFGMQ